MKILLAAQDRFFSEMLVLALKDSGYSVDCANEGAKTLHSLSNNVEYDLLVLEKEFDDSDGIQLVGDLRDNGLAMPIMMVADAEKDNIEDKIRAYDTGANDFMTKPFDFREMEARIRALLRKNVWGNKAQVSHGRLRFDTNTREVFLDESLLDLTPREVGLLEALLQRPGRLVNKRHLIDRLASWETEPSENAVEIVVHRLRRKLEPAEIVIHTVRGFGYLLAKTNEPIHA